MQLLAKDIIVHAFTPDDGSDSSAVKVAHRTAREEVINDDTISPRDNLRHGLYQLFDNLNPNAANIPQPPLMLFDRVRVVLPESRHDGEIRRISWDYTRAEWNYYVECAKEIVTSWYVLEDLDRLDQD